MNIPATIVSKTKMTSHRRLFRWASLHRKVVLCVVSGIWLVLPINASAAAISFTRTLLGGSQWKYDYTVSAAATDPAIEEFTIFFDPARYSNLGVSAVPLGWDPLIIQPDSGIPADGFFDALALVAGISPGASQGGFAVSFDFLGNGTPGAQRFDIVDPNTFKTLSSGFTASAVVDPPPPTSNVSEPNTLTLTGLALALFLGYRRRLPQKIEI